MAIRLSLDLAGATCADLLHFADAMRAVAVPESRPIEAGASGRIEVSADGHAATPGWAGPPGQPGRPFGPDPSSWPPRGRVLRHQQWGPPPGSQPQGMPHHVSSPPTAFGWSPEAVRRWRGALTEALESGGLSDAVRGQLLELREALSGHDGSHPGGS